jgi:predicted dienelactone hydrolase
MQPGLPSLRRVSGILAALLGAVAPASGLELPAPSGPFAIGARTFHWVDASRPEVAGPPGRNREVVVQLWYPTKGGGRPAPYVPDFEILATHARELDRLGLTILGAGLRQIRSLASHAVSNAPIAPDPDRHPVLLFSPGNSVPRFAYTIQLEELASYGYVVAAIDHPYSTGIVVLPGGRVALQAPGAGAPVFEERVATRAADMRFVLDRLSAEFAEHLDLTRVGVFGHSLGGIASVQVAGQDERFQAALNEDGGDGTLDEALRRGAAQPLGLRAPVMLIVKVTPVVAPTTRQLACLSQLTGLAADKSF